MTFSGDHRSFHVEVNEHNMSENDFGRNCRHRKLSHLPTAASQKYLVLDIDPHSWHPTQMVRFANGIGALR